MRYFYISLLIFTLNTIQASIYGDIKKNVLSLFQRAQDEDSETPYSLNAMSYFQHKKQEDAKDNTLAKNKANILKLLRTHEKSLNSGRDMPSSKLTEILDEKIVKEHFHLDPVLNELKNRRGQKFRRKGGRSGSSSLSSSMEMQYWKDEWDEHWMQKKFEALNSSQYRGDVVNMVAARPWGVPCGDPNQHDMPWGNCMLPPECDAEFRIYRGDYFCGRSRFICCAVQITSYDLYQGLDISFEGSSFSTDTDEKNSKGGSKENAKKDRMRAKRKRKRERDNRKRRMRKSIRNIITEIRKILNRAYRNGTGQRKQRTKELKRFIKMMKKQYRKDRKSVLTVHEHEMTKLDETLQRKFDLIKGLNQNFMNNDTFRDIVINGTVNTVMLRKLLRKHPDLAKIFKSRRTGDDLPLEEEETESKPLEYDLEYGMLYY